jgi:hypothetical protein
VLAPLHDEHSDGRGVRLLSARAEQLRHQHRNAAEGSLYNAIVDQRLTLLDDPESRRTRRTRRRSTRAAGGGSPSPTTGRTSTASSPSRWPSSAPRSSPSPWSSWDGSEALPRLRSARPRSHCRICQGIRNRTNPYWRAEWRRLSVAVTARDGACVECGSTRHLQAHHDLARADGGPDTPENLVTLARAATPGLKPRSGTGRVLTLPSASSCCVCNALREEGRGEEVHVGADDGDRWPELLDTAGKIAAQPP